jgi:hypothetical protein
MKIFFIICLVTLPLFIVGCATGYTSYGLTGGYSDQQIEADVFLITFNGNGYTDLYRSRDFAFLRAADVTLAHGYICFAVLKQGNRINQSSYTTDPTVTTYGQYNNYNNTYTATSYYDPGETTTFYTPESGLLIRCFHSPPPNIHTYDARNQDRELRTSYKLSPWKG